MVRKQLYCKKPGHKDLCIIFVLVLCIDKEMCDEPSAEGYFWWTVFVKLSQVGGEGDGDIF